MTVTARSCVAVDLLGGDAAPDVTVAGARAALADDPDLALALVGPAELTQSLWGEFSAEARGRVRLVEASQHIGMAEPPARAVRAKRDAAVVVAARLVRDGIADAMVSVGSTGAAMAAAVVTLGRLPGVSRPALAAVVPAVAGPVVLLDVGANPGASADLLVQFALVGVAYAQVRLEVDRPRVGLLNVGTEPGKGDAVRRGVAARLEPALQGSGAHFLGNVEGSVVARGGEVDVLVTDGFTGNVLVKGIEGMVDAMGQLLGPPAAAVLAAWRPEAQDGAVLLGVDGVVVLGHGSSTAPAVARCIAAAAAAARGALLPRVREMLGAMGRTIHG